MSDYAIPPRRDEVEVSLFGPGYGEALALHLGDQHWVLVDSCLDPRSKVPAALRYLADLNIEVADAVRLVVATHWHDDHIRGLGSIFDACTSARFVLSDALRGPEFNTLAGHYHQEPTTATTGLSELLHILRAMDARVSAVGGAGGIKLALADRVLYATTLTVAGIGVPARLSALSPSDAAVLKAKLAFEQLTPIPGTSKRRIPGPTPNHASVVLWAEIGGHSLLLGADLEDTTNSATGWAAILDGSLVVASSRGAAAVFKVAHHGSANAHHPRVWSKLVAPEPVAILTPYRRGKRPLPSRADADRITALTSRAYITAPPRLQRHRQWHFAVNEMHKIATREMHNVHAGWGHIRLRCPITGPAAAWRVDLFGDARALASVTYT
jgi:beta-lactamase superfamily II metal-dependent hydrolase